MTATPMSEALQAFYQAEGLPLHGNQEGRVDWATILGVQVPFPNLAFRKALLPYHDAIHLVTGYHTDEIGEGEVSAWSLAAGGDPLTALPYDLGGFANGLVRGPRRTIAAFYRGRGCRTPYHVPVERLLATSVDALRAEAGVDRPPRAPTLRDHLALVGYVALATSPVALALTALTFAAVGWAS